MKKTLWSILLLVGCCALPTLAEVNNCRHVSKDILYPEQAIEDEKAKDLEQQAKQRRQTAYDVCIAGVEKSFAGQLELIDQKIARAEEQITQAQESYEQSIEKGVSVGDILTRKDNLARAQKAKKDLESQRKSLPAQREQKKKEKCNPILQRPLQIKKDGYVSQVGRERIATLQNQAQLNKTALELWDKGELALLDKFLDQTQRHKNAVVYVLHVAYSRLTGGHSPCALSEKAIAALLKKTKNTPRLSEVFYDLVRFSIIPAYESRYIPPTRRNYNYYVDDWDPREYWETAFLDQVVTSYGVLGDRFSEGSSERLLSSQRLLRLPESKVLLENVNAYAKKYNRMSLVQPSIDEVAKWAMGKWIGNDVTGFYRLMTGDDGWFVKHYFTNDKIRKEGIKRVTLRMDQLNHKAAAVYNRRCYGDVNHLGTYIKYFLGGNLKIYSIIKITTARTWKCLIKSGKS